MTIATDTSSCGMASRSASERPTLGSSSAVASVSESERLPHRGFKFESRPIRPSAVFLNRSTISGTSVTDTRTTVVSGRNRRAGGRSAETVQGDTANMKPAAQSQASLRRASLRAMIIV